jgi:hypothetical protein
MAEAIAGQRLRTGRQLAAGLLALALLSGCTYIAVEDEPPPREIPPREAGTGPSLPPESPAPMPPLEQERSTRPVPLPAPEPEPLAPPTYHAAGEAMVEQARREVLLGNDALAGATLERALRVDGNNPWIWIELGYLRLTAGQAAAAESMARKAVSLSTRDPAARAEAARLLQKAGAGQ